MHLLHFISFISVISAVHVFVLLFVVVYSFRRLGGDLCSSVYDVSTWSAPITLKTYNCRQHARIVHIIQPASQPASHPIQRKKSGCASVLVANTQKTTENGMKDARKRNKSRSKLLLWLFLFIKSGKVVKENQTLFAL